MGISIRHVLVVAIIFAAIGFGYVVGFAKIDPVRSPRAHALNATPSLNRLVTNIRTGMVNGQLRGSRAAADDLIRLYPDNPRSWLNRGYAYRTWQNEDAQSQARRSWWHLLSIIEQQDIESLTGTSLGTALYLRGWALRGLGRTQESKADFTRVARMLESSAGITQDAPIPDSVNPATAYNLACYWAVAGETDRALQYWQICAKGGYLTGSGLAGWWRVDPDLEDLWNNERFWKIAEENE